MLKTLSLVLPALIPSWQFFKTIEASPRVRWGLSDDAARIPDVWHAFRPRPQTVSPWHMLRRLFWNPDGNEALFIVSCAERIAQEPTAHSIAEITSRILVDINALKDDHTNQMMRFQLVFVQGEGAARSEDIVFISDPIPVTQNAPQ